LGTKDPNFPNPATEGRMISEQTGGTLALVDGTGHYPQTEIPEQAKLIVLDFLKRSPLLE